MNPHREEAQFALALEKPVEKGFLVLLTRPFHASIPFRQRYKRLFT